MLRTIVLAAAATGLLINGVDRRVHADDGAAIAAGVLGVIGGALNAHAANQNYQAMRPAYGPGGYSPPQHYPPQQYHPQQYHPQPINHGYHPQPINHGYHPQPYPTYPTPQPVVTRRPNIYFTNHQTGVRYNPITRSTHVPGSHVQKPHGTYIHRGNGFYQNPHTGNIYQPWTGYYIQQ